MKLILLQDLVQGDVKKKKKKKKKILRKNYCLCEKLCWDHFLPCHRLGFTLRRQQLTHATGQKTKLHKYGHIILYTMGIEILC